ncbi:MAG: hypothetical protein L3K11_07220 [Thermoplasmata archaeon]|nr:hypothetical protein [Thermoplasmata archaeon]
MAALGGILVILGGILGFLLSLGPHGFGDDRIASSVGSLLLGVLAVIFGVIILVYSGFTHFGGVDRSLSGGLILIVLGIVTWILVGDWVLVAVGSFLTVLAGLVILAELLLSDSRIRVR